MRALFLLACSAVVVSCSSKSDEAQPDTGVSVTTDTSTDTLTGGRKLDGEPALDNTAVDPVPAELPVVFARTKASAGPQMDVPADFSCQGQPQPTVDTTLIERDFHTVELGGADTDRVPSVKFEIFNVNKYPGTATLTATSSAGADGSDPTRGSVKLKTATGNHAWHVFPQAGHFEIVVLDYSIDATQLVVPITAAPEGKVAVIETLVGGSGYMFTPGNSRYVFAVRDCKDLDLMGVHVALEVDGKVTAYKDGGAARSYFGDNKLPSIGKWTSRSGVVAFVNVPSSPKLRLVARARLSAGAAPEVVAMRTLPALPNGIVTGIVAPHTEP